MEDRELCYRLPPVVMVGKEIAAACLDKFSLMQRTQANGVPIAPFSKADNQPDLERVLEQVGMPSVLRPFDSTLRLGGRKAVTVSSLEEARALDIDWRAGGVLVQRQFEGQRHNLYFAARNGKIVRYLHAVIDRTDHLDGSGLAVAGRTVAPDPQLRSHTQKLVSDLGYHGIGCAQFLVNPQSGACSFLEINPRIAGNHVVPERAGLDLGGFLVDLALGREVDDQPREGRAGLRYAWTSGELSFVKSIWRRQEVSGVRALALIVRAVVTAARTDIHIVFSVADPLPGLVALADAFPFFKRYRKAVMRWRNRNEPVFGIGEQGAS